MFDLRPVPTGKEYIQVGNGAYLRVQCVGKVNMAFHMQDQGGELDFCVQMSDVYVVPGITFNLFSLHHTQRKQRIVLDETGVHLFDGRLSFAYSDVGCSLWATRLPQDYCGRAVTSSPDAPPRVSAQASPPSIGTGFVAATPSLCQSAGTGTSASATSCFQSVAPAGVVPSTADVQPTGSDGVVPSSSSVPSTTSGVVLPICAFPSVDVDPTPTTIPDFQPVITAAVESSSIVSPPAVELTDFREIEINPLFSQDALPIMDMSMFLDVGLMDGKDTVPPGDFFPDALELAESSDPPHLAFTVQHDDLEVLSGFLSECNEQQAAAPPSLSHALAIIAPGASPFSVGKSTPTIDINLFHASTGHVNEFLMRETAKQQGVRLVGELQPCAGCVEAKGRRALVPRRGTRAAVPFGKVHIDLTGPFTEAMDGSRYPIMFVDSASRWQRGYGMRAKSDTLKYVKRFLADMNGMGTPGCFRMDNGGEFTGAAFIEFCDAAGIRREYTAPNTPKQNAVAESAIWRAMKGGHAARRHILSMAHVDLASVPNIGANGQRLWLSSALWTSGCFNRSATKANQGWMSPFEAFFGRKPPLNVVPFFQEGMMRVKRAIKADVQSVRCFYLHGANNHSTVTAVVLRADTGRLALTNNFVWVNRRAAAPAPVPGSGGGSSVTAAPSPAAAVPAAAAAPPPPPPARTYMYTPHAPATTAAPPASPSIFTGSSAPSPISVAPSSAPPSTAATPPRSPPGLTPPPQPADAASPAPSHSPLTSRAFRELGGSKEWRGAAGRVHGRTRGDGVRFMNEQQRPPAPPDGDAAQHRLGLLAMMDKDALISSLATREAVGQGRHEPPMPPPPPPDPSFGDRGSGGAVGAGGPMVSGGGGSQHGFAAKFATREDVDAALRAERPPDKVPDLPHCMAGDLREPKTFNEAMRSPHSELWGDAVDPLACEQNLDLCHFDIQQAFVQSGLDEDVFMRLPQGCGRLSGLIVKLCKSLYGLKQASRHWHSHLTRCLLLLGFLQCLADACVFRLMEEGRVIMIIVVHVDDIFAVGQKERCDKFGEDLNEMVPVKNLGELRWYSACFYERDVERGLLRISQQRFAEELAAEYGIEWGRSVPLPVSVKLTDFDENEACADVPFRELVGSLMWLATQTRPDIANAVRAVAWYCASPKMVHWKAALGILGYVRRTSWMGITFERGVVTGMSMQVFVDADYASKATDRRSVSGGLVMCGGGCVTWFSRTQKCVTLSTTEAEYVAIADVLKEVLFLRQVWRFMLPDAGSW
ncbi:unnamed protein product [Ectocarpus sp. CCAP 1310/34]|nr:unnamed protein product [Ectocarpus sp. CCAP 1310/34]